MYCPNCAEPRAQENIQFCTKCGHDVTGGRNSTKGMRQGFILIAIGILLIPVWMFIGPAFPANDRFVESAPSTTWLEQIAWILMWVAYLAGAARIAFALVFERAFEQSAATTVPSAETPLAGEKFRMALPSGEAFQAVEPGGWKTTGELLEPILRKPKTSGEL